MILIYIGCFLLLLYYLFTRNSNYWESKGIPFDKPFLFFGSFYSVATRKEHIFEKIRSLYNQYKNEPYFGIYIFNQPNLVIRSPELLRKVLVKDFDKFVNRNFAANESVDPISFHALGTAKDTIWKNLRAKISPAFTSGKMKLMLPLIKECGESLSDYFDQHSGETMEMRSLTKKYAVDIIASCAFGINSHCLKNDDSEFLKTATKMFDFKSFVRSFSVFSFMFVPKFVDIFRLTFADKASSEYFKNVFFDTLKEREKKNIVRHDFIDLLNNLKKNETFKDDYKFDDIKMAAQAIIFFSAGNDTTSMTLTYTYYELATNTDVQDRLRQEVTEIFNKHGDFTYEAIQEMKYLDMVLNEGLRKYPLTSFLNRKSTNNYTFEETGLMLDKDVNVLVPVVGLHFDPEYFPNPYKFDPERFSDENKHNIKPYTFLPFGEGPRNCIGQRFAVLVSKMALAYSVKNFVFETTDATAIPLRFDPAAFFLETTTGVSLKVTKI